MFVNQNVSNRIQYYLWEIAYGMDFFFPRVLLSSTVEDEMQLKMEELVPAQCETEIKIASP